MDFKRLHNMTGKDPVLNRRITSIFLNEFDSFKKVLVSLPTMKDIDHFQFLLHKIKPSMVIFELDTLVKKYEELLDTMKSGDSISVDDSFFIDAINQTDAKIQMVKGFLNTLP